MKFQNIYQLFFLLLIFFQVSVFFMNSFSEQLFVLKSIFYINHDNCLHKPFV